jgi:peroxin-13
MFSFVKVIVAPSVPTSPLFSSSPRLKRLSSHLSLPHTGAAAPPRAKPWERASTGSLDVGPKPWEKPPGAPTADASPSLTAAASPQPARPWERPGAAGQAGASSSGAAGDAANSSVQLANRGALASTSPYGGAGAGGLYGSSTYGTGGLYNRPYGTGYGGMYGGGIGEHRRGSSFDFARHSSFKCVHYTHPLLTPSFLSLRSPAGSASTPSTSTPGGYSPYSSGGYGSYGSYGGLGGLASRFGMYGGAGGMYGSSMYGGGGMYGGSALMGSPYGGAGMGMGMGMYQDPALGPPPGPPRAWDSFLRVVHGFLGFFGRISFLVDENAQAIHFFITALLQLLDRFGSLYGELARFVLRMLGFRVAKKGGPPAPAAGSAAAPGPGPAGAGDLDSAWKGS